MIHEWNDDYYYSYITCSLIPEERFVTTSSIIYSISATVNVVFTIASAIVISLISYFWSIIIAVIITIILDLLYLSFLTSLKKGNLTLIKEELIS